MIHEAVLDPGLAKGDLKVGFRELLKVVCTFDHWIVKPLSHASSHQMKDDLSVFGVVLVPGIVKRFAGASHSDRGNET